MPNFILSPIFVTSQPIRRVKFLELKVKRNEELKINYKFLRYVVREVYGARN